ncbi:hypothetical protein J2Z21_006985 [Streptomyces griseochromogenes]|nr:hypothetical protein [Streptomyces griseochromogenes]MBP2053983.1 hypothetical protein [Streptomyces griseochromogenes]
MSELVRAYAEERVGLDEPASAIRQAARRLQQHMTAERQRMAGALQPAEAVFLQDISGVPAYLRRACTVAA